MLQLHCPLYSLSLFYFRNTKTPEITLTLKLENWISFDRATPPNQQLIRKMLHPEEDPMIANNQKDCFCGKIKCDLTKHSNKNSVPSSKSFPEYLALHEEPVFPFHHSLKQAIDQQIDNGLDLQISDPKLTDYQKAREQWKDRNVNIFVNNLTSETLKIKPKPQPLLLQNTSTPRRLEKEKSVLPNIYVESPIYAPPQFREEHWIDSPRDAAFPLRAKNQFEMEDLTINEVNTSKNTKEIQFSKNIKIQKDEIYSEKCENICQLICILFILGMIAGFGYFIYWYFFTEHKSYY